MLLQLRSSLSVHVETHGVNPLRAIRRSSLRTSSSSNSSSHGATQRRLPQLQSAPTTLLRPMLTSTNHNFPERRGGGVCFFSDLPAKPSQSSLTSKDGVTATHAIDFDVAAKIEGNESQIVIIRLEPGQVLRAESGAMMYMTDGVEMNTTTGGGLSTGFQRMLTGQNFFISDYTYNGAPGTEGTVALGTDFPSKIVRLNVPEYGGKITCQKGALLCASHTVDIAMEFSKNFQTGFFGGEGFVLQGLTGDGDVFVKAGGTVIRRDLKEGEQLRVSAGCLVAFSQGVDYGKSWSSFFFISFVGQPFHQTNCLRRYYFPFDT